MENISEMNETIEPPITVYDTKGMIISNNENKFECENIKEKEDKWIGANSFIQKEIKINKTMNRNPPVPTQRELEETLTCWLSFLYAFEKCLRKRVWSKPSVAVDYGYCDGIGVWACASSCGYRPYMEDRYVVSKFKQEELFLAVFDGHGMPGNGHVVSEYCEANFADLLSRQLTNILNQSTANVVPPSSSASAVVGAGATSTSSVPIDASPNSKHASIDQTRPKNQSISTDISYTTAAESEPILNSSTLHQAFLTVILDIDSNLRKLTPKKGSENGSTFSGVLLLQHNIVFANVGDSRSIIWRDGAVIFETLDHKPSAPGEAERISKAGGFVYDNRVNGDLAVSHTIGDLMFKPADAPIRSCTVSPEPDVTLLARRIVTEELWERGKQEYQNVVSTRQDKSKNSLWKGKAVKAPIGLTKDVILIATDGLWDVFTSEEVMDLLQSYLGDCLLMGSDADPNTVAQMLADGLNFVANEAMLNRMSSDNITLLGFIIDSRLPENGTRTSESKSRDGEVIVVDYNEESKMDSNSKAEENNMAKENHIGNGEQLEMKEEISIKQTNELEQVLVHSSSSNGKANSSAIAVVDEDHHSEDIDNEKESVKADDSLALVVE